MRKPLAHHLLIVSPASPSICKELQRGVLAAPEYHDLRSLRHLTVRTRWTAAAARSAITQPLPRLKTLRFANSSLLSRPGLTLSAIAALAPNVTALENLPRIDRVAAAGCALESQMPHAALAAGRAPELPNLQMATLSSWCAGAARLDDPCLVDDEARMPCARKVFPTGGRAAGGILRTTSHSPDRCSRMCVLSTKPQKHATPTEKPLRAS